MWGMLTNPAYCGRAAFRKTMSTATSPRVTRRLRLRGQQVPGRPARRPRSRDEWIEIAVPPIVSQETFDLAARRLEENKRFAARRTKEPTLLQGLVVCRSCGYAYYRTSTRTSKRKIYYYRCLGSDNYRWENGRVCDNRPVRQDELDTMVWEQVVALLTNPELIRHELDRRIQEIRSSRPATTQKAKLERELHKINRATERLVNAYQEGLLTLEELRPRMPELRQRQTRLRSDLEALEAQLLDSETYLQLAENLESFLSRLRDSATTSSIERRQQVVRLLVKEVLVDSDSVVIRHSIPSLQPRGGPGYLLRGRGDEARSFLKKVFQLPADLLPDPEGGRLVVRLYGMANPRSNPALAVLCDVLNQLEVTYPGTSLRLVLEAPRVAPMIAPCPGLCIGRGTE